MVPHLVRRKVRVTALYAHPRMELTGKKFYCNGRWISFARKPLASKVMRAFMSDLRQPLTREMLLAFLEKDAKKKDGTSRVYKCSREQSLNRLLSRLRLEFQQKFRGVVPYGTYWFHYADREKAWLLYKLPGEGPDGQLYA